MSAPDFPGRSMPFDDEPLRGDFRDMTEQMILRLREAFEEEALLEEGEDARMAEVDAARAERARAGELGPEWRAVQARIDLGQTSLEAVFSGEDESPAAQQLREHSSRRLREFREQWEEDRQDPDKDVPPTPAELFDETLRESQARFTAAAERIRDALLTAQRRQEEAR